MFDVWSVDAVSVHNEQRRVYFRTAFCLSAHGSEEQWNVDLLIRPCLYGPFEAHLYISVDILFFSVSLLFFLFFFLHVEDC